MWKLKDTIRYISFLILGRYSFLNALTLLMLLGERASRETYPPFEPKVIYSHLVVMVLCGACMSFDRLRSKAALVQSGQLLYLAFSIFNNQRLQYKQWTRIRMFHRHIGVAAIFLLYAFFNSRKPRNQQLRRIAEILLGVYTACAVYSLVESPEDKEAFLNLFPGGMISFYIYALLYCVAALCFLPGFFVYDAMQVFSVLLVLVTLFIDCNFKYWTQRRGMDFWNQVRVMSDNVAIFIGLLMYMTCTTKKIYVDKDDKTLKGD